MTDAPKVAVIGGSGFYSFLDDPESLTVDTPYGALSAPIGPLRLPAPGRSRPEASLST